MLLFECFFILFIFKNYTMPRRRLYVNALTSVLSSGANQTSMINWAVSKGIDTFEYYGLKGYLTPGGASSWTINTSNANTLGNFIAAARTAGIPNHIAVMGGYWEGVSTANSETNAVSVPFGNHIVNNYHTAISYAPTKSFLGANSGLNIELEYWWDHTLGGGTTYPNGVTRSGYNVFLNGGTVTDEQSENFRIWCAILKCYATWSLNMKSSGRGLSMFEVYIGFFNPAATQIYQCSRLGNIMGYTSSTLKSVNVTNIHAYRAPTSNSQTLYGAAGYAQRVWAYCQNRVGQLGAAYAATYGPGKKLRISLIYSFEPAFSGPWFSANPSVTMDAFHTEVMNQFNAATFNGKASIEIEGYTIFEQTLVRAIIP